VCGLQHSPPLRVCDPNPYKQHDPDRRTKLLADYEDAVQEPGNAWDPNLTAAALQLHNVDLGCGRQRRHHHPANKASTPPTAHQLPWVRPQPETAICPVCPVKGNKLFITLNPAVLGAYLPANGPVTLGDATLQFGDTSANLGDLTIYSSRLTINLVNYKIGTSTAVELFNLDFQDEGTLTVTVKGADGRPATLTSSVQVLH